MSQAWCNEYRQLCIKSEALQRECTKIKEKLIRESQLLPSCLVAKRTINKKKGHQGANNDKVSMKQDWQHDKRILGEKIHRLHEHCATIKDSLLILLTKKEIMGAEERRERKRAKQLCKEAIEAYEDQYESLRYQCDNEITNLESKWVGLYQSIMCMMMADC